jgi:two-component system chemotaxis response regulator CheB
MGSDGLAGCAALADAGAAVVAQDQASSVVWGMPGAVVRAGLADAVVPLERVAAELTVRLGQR